jgi:dihydrolipoamide dehydrogenase
MANSQTTQVDVVVIGAGPAGYVCAIRLAQLGRKVTIIDKDNVGGVCLNRGCIPSKALIYAGTLYEKIQHGSDIGIEVSGAKVNLEKMINWKDTVVKKLTGGVAQLLKANGCTLITGDAQFTSPSTLEVTGSGGTQTLQFKQCVVATGSRPLAIPGIDVDHDKILDSTSGLDQKKIPKTLLCIGGGYIGLELGTFYAKVGSKVTVVEAAPTILSIVDPDLVKVVAKGLQKRGVTTVVNTKVKACKKTKDGVDVTWTENGKDSTQTFEKVLMTIGRTPNTDQLALDKAGVKLDSKGFIPVDARRCSNIPTIFAIGDVAGQPLLAHKGSKEGIVAAEAMSGLKTVYDVIAMPAVIFTDPEIATVGLSEAEAKAEGYEVQVGNFPFVANGRALSVNETDGFVKMIGDRKTGRLLGVHIVGAEASNLIAEATLALEMGASVEDIALTVHAHPTLPETLMEAADATLGHAIHIFQPKPRSAPQPEARA